MSILKDRTVYSISSQGSFLWPVLHHGLFLKVVLVFVVFGYEVRTFIGKIY